MKVRILTGWDAAWIHAGKKRLVQRIASVDWLRADTGAEFFLLNAENVDVLILWLCLRRRLLRGRLFGVGEQWLLLQLRRTIDEL